jgi:hypothetical protein
MPDNIAYQPHRGNWIFKEDGSTSDFIEGSRNDDAPDCPMAGQHGRHVGRSVAPG